MVDPDRRQEEDKETKEDWWASRVTPSPYNPLFFGHSPKLQNTTSANTAQINQFDTLKALKKFKGTNTNTEFLIINSNLGEFSIVYSANI